MKSSDIKIGHVYYVDYEPVKDGEFNGRHLSVVMKKNNDKATFVVMPLTSSPNGDGANKLNIGKITGLPSSIKTKDTYAVYNQVRTVNAMRFFSVKNGNMRIDVSMANTVLLNLFELRERFTKAENLAYIIIKLRKATALDNEKITALKNEIRETLKGVPYILDVRQTADGIQDIFDESLSG